MNRLRLGAVIPALTVGLALPVVAYAHGQGNQSSSATEPIVQSQSEQSTLPTAKEDGTANTQLAPRGETKTDQGKAKKHPPTAIMDQATPPDKSASEKASSAKL